ncbi:MULTISPECIES: glycine cleavage system transcriptional repressor [Aliamphritea]|uniref:glycine cleavage system protein R n=1 Tax=Aliamphritea TaxID=3018276 RepID=UPI00196B378B|nr:MULTISPECIES: ACT domain-containing protein [Aliamphritea]MBN3564639.1 glycine cleavage system protein R [Aliamphritea spongicola]
MTSLVLTVIAQDKPGLVELLSETIANHQGNWQESSMSRLAGQFAGILIIEVPQDHSEALTAALNDLQSQGLNVNVTASKDAAPEETYQHVTIELIGHDKPGIVREISHALNSLKINVESLSTELVSGSMSAEELFKAEASLRVPTSVELDDLQNALEDIANDLMVDLNLN